MVCRYHKGGRLDKTIVLVVAWVEGIGLVLPILEGGRCACHFVFWAAQTAVAASELCVGTGRSLFSPYLPPHTAATAIQCMYRSYDDKVIKEYLPPHTAATAIQRVCRSYVDKVITEWLQSRQLVDLQLLLDTLLG